MKHLWEQITNIGIGAGTDYQLSKKIRITNQIVASASLLAFLYIFIFYFAGFHKEGLEVILIVISAAAPLLFNKNKWYLLARIWFLATINVAVLLYSYLFGEEVGIDLVFFACVGIPWILFELYEWGKITIGIAMAASGYFIFSSGGGAPILDVSPDIALFIHNSIAVAVFILVCLCMFFLALQNFRSESFLQETYRQFFEDIPSPMWIFEEQTLNFLAVNDKAIERYGFTRDEFLRMKVTDIRPNDYKDEVNVLLKAMGASTSFDAGYLKHRRKNGEVFFAHILSNRTFFKGKNGRVALAIDVNDKVIAEKKNEELNRVLVQTNQDLQRSKESLESQEEELRQINEELTQQTEELRASEEELKTQEEELRQINAELNEKTTAIELARRALETKTVELEAASRYKSEFLANMSHELRTPLNSVLILANLLKDNKTRNLTEKQIEYAGIIHKSGSDLLRLINDILDLSKIEAGKVEIFNERVKTRDIANDLEQLFTVIAAEKSINYTTIVDESVPAVLFTDKQRLEQVVKNLLANAFKFTPVGGNVQVHFTVQNGMLAISVKDSGIGISPEKQQLIFEAFQQADGSTSRRFGGTGLGLSISKELIKRMNGEIRLASAPGEGSTFIVLVPMSQNETRIADVPWQIKDAPVYAPEKVKEQEIIKDDKAAILPGESSLLIIEDDPVFANYVKEFAHTKGYKTIVAISGDEGIFYAKKFKPSAIILDLGLPVIDGRNVLNHLKSDIELKHIPVHVVTAEDRTDIPMDRIESYLRKPLKDQELELAFSEIETHLREDYKNILILSPENEWVQNMIEGLFAKKAPGVVYELFQTPEEALSAAKQKHFDCLIADIGNDVPRGIGVVEVIKHASPATYIITCLEGDISTNDEKLLKASSDSIIRKSNFAMGRLMDEVELFLHKVKSPVAVAVPLNFQKEMDKSLSGKKVLIADDDMRNVFALTAVLEEQGMKVMAAEHGKEALEMLEQHNDVDIILMDIMMPEMDGYETMRRIRAGGAYKKSPIIALTAKAMTGDREKCLEAGASDYITKPVDSSKLFSLMRVWLS